jgi:hypothetical protein
MLIFQIAWRSDCQKDTRTKKENSGSKTLSTAQLASYVRVDRSHE